MQNAKLFKTINPHEQELVVYARPYIQGEKIPYNIQVVGNGSPGDDEKMLVWPYERPEEMSIMTNKHFDKTFAPIIDVNGEERDLLISMAFKAFWCGFWAAKGSLNETKSLLIQLDVSLSDWDKIRTKSYITDEGRGIENEIHDFLQKEARFRGR